MSRYPIYVDGNPEPFWCDGDESVLTAMQRAGDGPVYHGCFGGGCGVCKMTVIRGAYERFKPMSRAHVSAEEEQNGMVLICCIQPRGEVYLMPTRKKE